MPIPPASTSFPGGVGIQRAQQMPQAPVHSMYSEAGQALQEVGDVAIEYDKDTREIKEQEARLDNMIRKRQLAQKVQASKVDMDNKRLEFDQASADEKKRQFDEQQDLRKEAGERAKEKAERDKSKQEAAEKEAQNFRDFNEELKARRDAAKEEGTTLSKNEMEDIAENYRIAGTTRANRIINRWFPNYRPSATGEKETKKKDEAGRAVKFLESELQQLLNQVSKTTGTKYLASRIIQDPYSMEKSIEQIPQEMRRLADITKLQKEIRKKISEINKAKVKAGDDYVPSDADLNAVMDELERLKYIIAEKEEALK